ncbi:Pycsar system effector family protein [Flagellimonas amoyensis]|uniref:Pycsar system effector family protein n=1 Tax=Flagellimonas amoyensis TaxID=2169401 RepID=UPI000D365DBF|nr:Pycsar system effector family protein [Allomuricauda amoyensis]
MPIFQREFLKQLESRGHAEELVDHYWGSINYVLGLIRASEIKAGLLLSFYGILLNFIFQKIDLLFSQGAHQIVLYIFMAFWFLATIVSIYFSIRCFMPRIEGKYEKNMFFFGDVISKFGTINDFSKSFYRLSLKEEELFDQLGQQIFIISKIADQKFRYVNRSLRFLAISLLLFLLMAIYYAVLVIK